jgi:hypothetical protein
VASPCSVLICSSLVYHFDWPKQIAVVAIDAAEPDILLEI